MFSQAISILLCTLLVSFSVFANEGGEEKKEGGGGEHGGAPAAPVQERRTTEASYNEVLAKVSALETKVHSAEAEIEKLIEEKQHTKDPKRAQEIIAQMVKLHHEMEKNAKEYDQQRSLLKYRYPEKAGAEKREYERLEVKSLDEMEDAMSLSSSVNKTLKKVRRQYVAPDESAIVKKEAKSGKKKNGETANPDLAAPVILKK